MYNYFQLSKCTNTLLHTHVPVSIYPEMTYHSLDQAKYPIYQQHPMCHSKPSYYIGNIDFMYILY